MWSKIKTKKIWIRFKRWVIFGVLGTGVVIASLVSTPSTASPSFVCDIQSVKIVSIENIIASTNKNERAGLKGCEIAKIGSIAKTVRGDYSVEITSFNPIEKGVVMFVKAWDNNRDSIGFGKDGTVEIERFVIVNPPILIDDPNGDIVRTWTDIDTGELKTRKLREDSQEALLQIIEHTLSVKKQIHSEKNIIAGKVGNTTLIAYPNAGTGTAPIDGKILANIGSGTFTELVDATGADAQTSGVSSSLNRLQAIATTDRYSIFNQLSVHLFKNLLIIEFLLFT